MGITISYRGRLADLARVEDFEDRLIDFALEVGGQAQIWRSHADDDPQRMVRGVLLNLAPGQETTSLLLSPEGWLISLIDIEAAEDGLVTEPPWCFVKTQFGPLEGHVALIEMFTELRREFMPELELSDEGGYYPTGDLAELIRRRNQLEEAIDAVAQGLQHYGLSREAAEDPEIVAHRIERVAAQVQRILRRPAEHPPVTFPDEGFAPPDPEADEVRWNELYKHNRRQQERLRRAIEERRSQGEEDTAFENALSDLGLEPPDEEAREEDEPWHEEPEFFAEEEKAPFASAEEEHHPLLRRAIDLLKRLHLIFRNAEEGLAHALRPLLEGVGDVMGGLAQALPEQGEEVDPGDYGLRVTQLKRALRGVGFARGALLPLRSGLTAGRFDELRRTLKELEGDIFQELARLRSEHQADDL